MTTKYPFLLLLLLGAIIIGTPIIQAKHSTNMTRLLDGSLSIDFTANQNLICLSENISITYNGNTNLNTSNIVYRWELDGGTASLNDLSGNTPFNVTWTTGGTKTITLFVKNLADDCTASFSQTIEVQAPPLTPQILCANTPSEVQFFWTNVSEEYEISISINGNAPTNFTTIENSYTESGLSLNNWVTIEVTALGDPPCGNSSTVTNVCYAKSCSPVRFDPMPLLEDTYCSHETITNLRIDDPAGEFVIDPLGITIPNGRDFELSEAVAGTNAVIYVYTGPIEQNCPAPFISDTITILPTPIPDFATNSVGIDTVCAGEQVTVSYTGTGNPEIHNWAFEQGTTVLNIAGGEVEVSWATAGTYEIGLTVEENGCEMDTTKMITVLPIRAEATLNPVCLDESITCTSATVVWNAIFGATQYEIQVNGQLFTTTRDTSVVLTGLPPNQTASIAIKVVVGNPCPFTSTEFTSCTTMGGIAEPLIICDSISTSIVHFNWEDIAGADCYDVEYSYGGNTFTENCLTESFLPLANLATSQAVVINVQAVGACGTSTVATQTCVTANCDEVVDLMDVPGDMCISDQPAAFSYVPINATLTGNGVRDLGNGMATFDPVIAGLGQHSISLDYTDEEGCPYQDFRNIEVHPVPTSDFTISQSSACIGETVRVEYTGEAGNLAIFTWDMDGAAPNITSGRGPHTIRWNTEGPKTIQLMVSENNCVSETTTEMINIVTPLEAANITCEQTITSVSFTWGRVDGATAYSIEVSVNGTVIETDANYTLTNYFAENLNEGDEVSIQVTPLGNPPCGDGPMDVLTCSVQSCPPTTPIIDLPNPTNLCNNDNPQVLFAAPTGGTFTLQGNPNVFDLTGNSLNPADYPVGNYLLIYRFTNEEGCVYTDDIALSIFETPIADFNLPDTVCVGEPFTLQYLGTNGVSNFNWMWDNSEVTTTNPNTNFPSPTLTYTQSGRKAIGLTVTQNACTSDLVEKNIMVLDTLVAPQVSCVDSSQNCVTFTWNRVTGAAYYEIRVNNGTVQQTTNLSEVLCGLNRNETVNFEITAIGEKDCQTSRTVQHTCTTQDCPPETIPAPQVICDASFSLDCVTFLWNGVPEAMAYEIQINNEAPILTTDTVEIVCGLQQNETVDLTIRVVPMSDCQVGLAETYSCTTDNCPPLNVNITNVVTEYCTANDPIRLMAMPAGGQFTIDGTLQRDLIASDYDLGTHEVIYTFTNNNCTYRDTALFTVQFTPVAAFNLADSICLGDTTTIVFTGQTNGGTINYNWNFDGGVLANNSSANPAVYWTTAGVKTLSLGIQEGRCLSSTIFQNITVVEPLEIPQPICLTQELDEVTFVWNEIDGAENYTVELFIVDGTDTLTNIIRTINDTTFTQPNLQPGQQVSMTVMAGGSGLCGNSEISNTAICFAEDCPMIIPTIDDFTATDFCETQDTAIVLMGTPAGGTFHLIDATNDTTIITTFEPDSYAIGNYTLQYAYTQDACSYQSTPINISIHPEPIANFDLPSEICVSDTARAMFTGVANAGASYIWVVNQMDTIVNTAMPSFVWENAGIQQVTLFIEDQACTDSISRFIEVVAPLAEPDLQCLETAIDSVVVGWNTIAEATGYVVQVAVNNQQLFEDTITATNIIQPNLQEGDTVVVHVMALGNPPCGNSIAVSDTCFAATCSSIEPFISLNDTVFCQQDAAISLNATPTGGVFTIQGSNTPITTFEPMSYGNDTLILQYEYQENQCIYYAFQDLIVYEATSDTCLAANCLTIEPIIALTDTVFCQQDAAILLMGTPTGGIFTIQGIDTPITTFNPIDYAVDTLILQYEYQENQCTYHAFQELIVYESIIADFTASQTNICITDSINFTYTGSPNATDFQWFFGTDPLLSVQNTPNPSGIQWFSGGIKTIKLVASTDQCVSDTAEMIITVVDVPATPLLNCSQPNDESLLFEWESIGNANLFVIQSEIYDATQQLITNNIDTTSNQSQSFSNLSEGDSVVVSVVAIGDALCGSSDPATESCTLIIESPTIVIPSAFSPNQDNMNDEFKVMGRGIDQIDLHIYDRWGRKMFQSNELDKGWDGFKNGELMPTGVYVYWIRVRYNSGKEEVLEGFISLVR